MKWIRGITFWRLLLVGIAVAGCYSIVTRFVLGLGATTGMNDSHPWGIWIGFDILCGVGLSAGAFTVAALVYVFKLEKYRPILRATVLTAFLGYIMAIVSLLCDLGMPQRIWHPLFMRNLHSPLFEVAMCVMIYTGILALEFSPALFERLGMHTPLRWVHTISLPLVIVGVLLSTLHQSSLGTLYIIVPNKLHGLWYSPLLPVLFFISAIGAGLSMVIFESYMSHRAFGTSLHSDILQGLGKGSAAVLFIYLLVRLTDLTVRNSIGLVMEGTVESRMFLLEMTLGYILPIALFLTPRVRRSRTGLYFTAVLVLCGFVLNRLNVSITGLQRYAGQTYFPSWMEIATTMFIVSCGFVAFRILAQWLPIFPAEHAEGDVTYAPLKSISGQRRSYEAPLATPAGFAFLSGLAMFFALAAIFERANGVAVVASSSFSPDRSRSRNVSLRMENASLRVPANQVFPTGPLSPGEVVFRHTTHVTGQRVPCETCHADLFPMQRTVFSHTEHTIRMMDRCGSCHNGKAAFEIRQACGVCHSKNAGSSVLAVGERQIRPPGDAWFTSQERSPGPVPFSHKQHMLQVKGDCVRCHPATFGMVSPDRSGLRMASMRRGNECGNCHNGRDAFTVAADCELCHRKQSTPAVRAAALVNRIPADRVLHGSKAAGAVAFSHRSHVSRGANCSTCHPVAFPMNATSRMEMKSMRRGKQCGACHNGREAFTVSADCGLCHSTSDRKKGTTSSPPKTSSTPADYKVPLGDGSLGAVTFSHAKHLTHTSGRCADCHKDIFPMRRPENGAMAMAKISGGQQCSACHDGKRAFAVDGDCTRCHVNSEAETSS